MNRLMRKAQEIAGQGKSVKPSDIDRAAKDLGLSNRERASLEASAGIGRDQGVSANSSSRGDKFRFTSARRKTFNG